jgi:CNT family concentrative nucleoside transporter
MGKELAINVEEDYREKPTFAKRSLKQFGIEAGLWVLLTAYFIAITIKSSDKYGYTMGCVVYSFISLRFLARHVSMSKLVYDPLSELFEVISVSVTKQNKFSKVREMKSVIILMIDAGLFLVSAIALKLQEGSTIMSRLQSLCGIVVLIGLTAIFSRDRKSIPWHTVGSGLFLQYLIALFVLKTEVGQGIFQYLSAFIADFLHFSHQGAVFIFGDFVPNSFAKSVLPAIVFFCSFIYIVYYWGGMQYIVGKMSWLFMIIMDTSGAESVVACASPFVGQGESALLVRPFVQHMTKSELHSTMTSGFATIAGSVLVYYLTIVRDPKTILTACVMSIPAGLLLSKIRYPEDEVSLTKGKMTETEGHEVEANFLHAATNGSATGMQLIILITGALLSIVSLLAAANFIVGWLFAMINIFDQINPPVDGVYGEVTVQLILSFIFAPIAWFIGAPWDEARMAGELMATKMIANEFIAYEMLGKKILENAFSVRTSDLLAFALCGFANVASIGIQIGALGAMAPERTGDLAELAFSAMVTGTVSTWLTAAVAGSLM